jgi:cysteine synthase A
MDGSRSKDPMAGPLICEDICDAIGRTPMVRLKNVKKEKGIEGVDIVLKMESMEPCSSVKDRLAKSLIEEAEKRGEISPETTVLVEPTSGNTGIGMAMVGASKGYECILVMPHTMSNERRVMLKALGAKLYLTPADKGVAGAIALAEDIVKNRITEGKVGKVLMQFKNMDNPRVHRETTGPEIWHQCSGQLDYLVGGVGTGGTMSGTTQFLKSVNPNLQSVAVEPAESPVLSGGEPGTHKIQGIGAGFIPDTCDRSVFDEIIPVASDEAIEMARALAIKDGILVGISAGAAVAAALQIATRPGLPEGTRICVIIPSFGERYLSTALFANLSMEAASQMPENIDHLM